MSDLCRMTSCKSLKSLLLDTVVTSYDTKIVPRKKMFPIKIRSQGQTTDLCTNIFYSISFDTFFKKLPNLLQ